MILAREFYERTEVMRCQVSSKKMRLKMKANDYHDHPKETKKVSPSLNIYAGNLWYYDIYATQ